MSSLRIFIAIGILLGITLPLHAFFWFRLVRSPQLPAPWSGIATLALILLALLMPGALFLQREAGRAWSLPLLWIAFTWMGLVLFFFCLLGAGEIVRAGLRILHLLGGLDHAPAPLALSRWIALAACAGSLILGGAAMISDLSPPGVKRVDLSLRRWPAALAGYTVVQISDLHIGPTRGRGFVEDLVRRVNALDPDLVAITGDLVDGEVASVSPELTALRDLRARDGVFFVTGNHDYYSGVEPWVAFVRSLGIRVLRNERVSLRGADGFDLAGVEDGSGHGPRGAGHADLALALEGRDTTRAVILLAHQPRQVVEASRLKVDLQLSGHTHGGQIYPFHYITRRFQPFFSGIYEVGSTVLYVSRGTGSWGPPMRLGAPAEITRVEIRPSAGNRG